MGAESVSVVCQSNVEKKVDHRRIPIGPTWKRKYCVLSTDALRLFRSKSKMNGGGGALRTVPLCHIKSVSRLYEDDQDSKINYFNVDTEQGETLTFRCNDGTGWVAQIQIQLIHYKNRQDIMRYKQLNNSMAVAENAIQRLRATSPNNNDVNQGMNYVTDTKRCKVTSRYCRTVVLPNHRHSGIGIGITVIPLHDGRVVVNRVLEGGPAMRLGVIQPRDQIVSANGHLVTSVEMLSEIVRNSSESVSLVVKPRISKGSPILDDPKDQLKQSENYFPEYINTAPDADTKRIFEKGFVKENCRMKESPRHFKFS